MSHRPVCSDCNVEFQCIQNHVTVLDEVNGEPYQLTIGDEYQCQNCGHRIIVGFAEQSVEQHEFMFGPMIANAEQIGLIKHNNVGYS